MSGTASIERKAITRLIRNKSEFNQIRAEWMTLMDAPERAGRAAGRTKPPFRVYDRWPRTLEDTDQDTPRRAGDSGRSAYRIGREEASETPTVAVGRAVSARSE